MLTECLHTLSLRQWSIPSDATVKGPGGNLVPGRKDAIRKRLAAYINCPPEQLAITRNTTEGVNTVLSGWKLVPGDEILTTTQEHEAFYGALAQRADREGVVVRKVRLPVPPSLLTSSPKQWKRRSLPARA